MRRVVVAVALLAVGCAGEPPDPEKSRLALGQEMLIYSKDHGSVVYDVVDTKKTDFVAVGTRCMVVDDAEASDDGVRSVRVKLDGVGVVRVRRRELRPAPK